MYFHTRLFLKNCFRKPLWLTQENNYFRCLFLSDSDFWEEHFKNNKFYQKFYSNISKFITIYQNFIALDLQSV